MNRCRALLLVLLWLASPGPAQAGVSVSIVTVGVGPTCDFNSLQTAINSASTSSDVRTVIWLSADMPTVGLLVIDRNITIRGNLVSCDSPATGETRHAIVGSGLNSVIRALTTIATPRALRLQDVVIRDGGADSASERGGGVHVEDRVALRLERVSVNRNVSVRGGGIAVVGPLASATIEDGTLIGNNPDLSLTGNGAITVDAQPGIGGGIYCQGGTLNVTNAIVRSNTAALHGGGIYVDDCAVTIEPDDSTPTRFLVTGNVAFNGDGGGIYVTANSEMFWQPAPGITSAGLVLANVADGSGGGLFITDSSNFVASWLRFRDNRADIRGGGVYADGDSNVILSGGDGMRCGGGPLGFACPGIFGSRGNLVGENATLIGGAIYARDGAQINLRQQHIFDNAANNGSALHLSGSATSATLSGVLIARNLLYGVGNGTSTVELTSSADITMRHVTMAGNFRASAAFPLVERALSSIRANGNQSEVELRNSSFFNDADSVIRLLVSATTSGSCVYAHENVSFPPGNTVDPQYIDTTGDFPDFRLGPTSPARDRCAASGPTEADAFGGARPIDLFGVNNILGPFDVGAFEAFGDELLRDSFEETLE